MAKNAHLTFDERQTIEVSLRDNLKFKEIGVILSILVYTLFSRMFDLMQPPVVKHSIAVA